MPTAGTVGVSLLIIAAVAYAGCLDGGLVYEQDVGV